MNEHVRSTFKSPDLSRFLQERRSCPIKHMDGPGPDRAQLDTILKIAARVPDHGKLFPWYFIVFDGDSRKSIGDALKQAWLADHPDASPAKLELEAERFLRAPVVVAVVSKIREGKKPVWEQILSAGAACMNLCLAANAQGFATNWVTEWYAYNDTFRKQLGIAENEHIAGFIYIGTPSAPVEERDRPDMERIVTFWQKDTVPAKGDSYGNPGLGYPENGFDFSGLRNNSEPGTQA